MSFFDTRERAANANPAPDEAMVWIPGGTFSMGSDAHYPEEAPAHRARVNGFWMDRHTVTNAEFAAFVAATGYVTLAERPANPEDYPGALPELLRPSSTVFSRPLGPVDMRNHYNWWSYVRGADWRHPGGPQTGIAELGEHPVVHVALEDVEAYAGWVGKQLPTEAEWEFAARGGLEKAEYAWGDELTPGGQHMANTWQGDFPYLNSADDGFEGTAPVESFPPNGFGLYDMAGNVWQWTADWYAAHRDAHLAINPTGASREASFDVRQPGVRIPRKVTKGGSHLCALNYCRRYRPAARMAQPVDTSISHLGFRLIVRATPG
ncbi:gliding motility-associated lipoprotein GldK [Devosia insulae DS-56]|uniref:Gliding motility-associated lipoprotein GldK n=1 Tax=Devosia insulae DS-56 TaxID=1116389 RepID=A0A1E5XM28_9HYPH|nr:formylglycine-generating enzyme family protein [Devosia insulae]OEO29629.1 gliding motility-associated lipoprotein GldK [Devosia insulae DS-56]